MRQFHSSITTCFTSIYLQFIAFWNEMNERRNKKKKFHQLLFSLVASKWNEWAERSRATTNPTHQSPQVRINENDLALTTWQCQWIDNWESLLSVTADSDGWTPFRGGIFFGVIKFVTSLLTHERENEFNNHTQKWKSSSLNRINSLVASFIDFTFLTWTIKPSADLSFASFSSLF